MIENNEYAVIISESDHTHVIESISGMGPRGPAGNAQRFTTSVAVASANWQVLHNLGYKPNVQVFDAFGRLVWAEIDHLSVNEFYVRFGSPQTGSVEYT